MVSLTKSTSWLSFLFVLPCWQQRVHPRIASGTEEYTGGGFVSPLSPGAFVVSNAAGDTIFLCTQKNSHQTIPQNVCLWYSKWRHCWMQWIHLLYWWIPHQQWCGNPDPACFFVSMQRFVMSLIAHHKRLHANKEKVRKLRIGIASWLKLSGTSLSFFAFLFLPQSSRKYVKLTGGQKSPFFI